MTASSHTKFQHDYQCICNTLCVFFLTTMEYGLPFYLSYMAHWPEYFQVAETPEGRIMGYSKYLNT